MHRDRDFDPQQILLSDDRRRDREVDPRRALTWNEKALIQDLELETMLRVMSKDDEFVFRVARKVLLTAFTNDLATIRYRQEILRDCLHNPEIVGELYRLVTDGVEGTRREWWGMSSRYPSSLLHSSINVLETSMAGLRRLRAVAEEQAARFQSEGFTRLFGTIATELSDEYLATVQEHLEQLKFRRGVLLSAELGERNEGANYLLRRIREEDSSWFKRLLGKGPRTYTFSIAERDEAGARILSEMQNRGISRVAVALAESADHVIGFFKALRTELAFYVGCLNLHDRLASKKEPTCFPEPGAAGERLHRFSGLYDVCLSLHFDSRVVGNSIDADGRSLVVITGANQGGKSTFLRGVGLAQVMMQCGMFVGAETFTAEVCPAVYTHYKREEDATMKSGKLDEELARMSEIVEHVVPDSMMLFNESFAATNEREGSEIATQIVSALLEKGVKVFFVTHLHTFARGLFDGGDHRILFLRAERLPDGARTFRMTEGEPLSTSHGRDLYERIFAEGA